MIVAAALMAATAAFNPVEFFRGRTHGEGALKVIFQSAKQMSVDSVGRTEKEARDKLQDYRTHADVEASLAHYAASTGVDLSKYGLDDPITQASTNANQSALAAITKDAPTPMTLRRIIDHMVLGSRMKPIV